MRRLSNEAGFTLIELAAVLLILGVLVALAVAAFTGFSSSAQTASAKANVRSAIPAAEKLTGTNGNYAGISGATLRSTTPGIGANVKAVAVNANQGYCIQDTENGGSTYYNYVGGNAASTVQPGYSAASIQPGTCLQAVSAAAG